MCQEDENLISSHCGLLTDDALSHLAGIERLEVSICPLISGSSFSFLPEIKYLNVCDCPLMTVEALLQLENVETLCVSGNIAFENAVFAAGLRPSVWRSQWDRSFVRKFA